MVFLYIHFLADVSWQPGTVSTTTSGRGLYRSSDDGNIILGLGLNLSIIQLIHSELWKGQIDQKLECFIQLQFLSFYLKLFHTIEFSEWFHFNWQSNLHNLPSHWSEIIIFQWQKSEIYNIISLHIFSIYFISIS